MVAAGLGSDRLDAAPLFWSAGYSAGLVGMAYLWADGRAPAAARAIFLTISVAMVGLVWSSRGRSSPRHACRVTVPGGRAAAAGHGRPPAQAVCEALILNNLGLDATTTADQALLFPRCSPPSGRGRADAPTGRPRTLAASNPLEAAGAALVVTTFGLIFSARDREHFDSLRALGWYDAMAELAPSCSSAGGAPGLAFAAARGPVAAASPRIRWASCCSPA